MVKKKFVRNILSNPLGGLPAPRSSKSWIRKNESQKNENDADFVKKILKFVVLKFWNHSIISRNQTVNYY